MRNGVTKMKFIWILSKIQVSFNKTLSSLSKQRQSEKAARFHKLAMDAGRTNEQLVKELNYEWSAAWKYFRTWFLSRETQKPGFYCVNIEYLFFLSRESKRPGLYRGKTFFPARMSTSSLQSFKRQGLLSENSRNRVEDIQSGFYQVKYFQLF